MINKIKARTVENALAELVVVVEAMPQQDRPREVQSLGRSISVMLEGEAQNQKGVLFFLDFLLKNLHKLQNADVRKYLMRGIILENIETSMRCCNVKNR